MTPRPAQVRLHLLPDGARLAYRQHGAGRPVVLLHGVLASSRWFEAALPLLAGRFRMFTIDFRSHGDSPPAEGGHTVSQFARDLRHFLVAHDLRGVVLAGWSMGALVAWEYLTQFPKDHRLSGVVAIGQSPSDWKRPGWEEGFFDIEALADVVRLLQEDREALLADFFEAEWERAEVRKLDRDAAATILVDQTLRDYRDVLAACAIPTLLVATPGDPFLTRHQVEWMQDNVPGLVVASLDVRGHTPFLEDPERFSQVVGDWIERLP